MTCEIRILTNHGVQRALLLLTTVTVFVFFCGFGGRPKHCLLKTDRVLARFSHLQLVCIALKICMQMAAELINTNKVLVSKNLIKTKAAIFYTCSCLVLLPFATPTSCLLKEPCIWASTMPQRCKLFVVSSLLLQL